MYYVISTLFKTYILSLYMFKTYIIRIYREDEHVGRCASRTLNTSLVNIASNKECAQSWRDYDLAIQWYLTCGSEG